MHVIVRSLMFMSICGSYNSYLRQTGERTCNVYKAVVS